jgi:hypothetical protein
MTYFWTVAVTPAMPIGGRPRDMPGSGVILTLTVGPEGVKAHCRPGDPITAQLGALLLALPPSEQATLCHDLRAAVQQELQCSSFSTDGLPSFSRARTRMAAAAEPRRWLEAECPSVYAEVREVAKELKRRTATGQKPRPPAAPLVLTTSPHRRPHANASSLTFLDRFSGDRASMEVLLERLAKCSAQKRQATIHEALRQAHDTRLSQLRSAERHRSALLAHLAIPPEMRTAPWTQPHAGSPVSLDVAAW